MAVPLMIAMSSNTSRGSLKKICITGGESGDYTKSLSGKKIPENAVLEDVVPVVEQIPDITAYNLNDIHFLQWEDWSEIVKFAPIPEVREYIIQPMLENGMSHNRHREL